MNWREVQNFIDESGGRALVVVDGSPGLVVMSYEDYQGFRGRGSPVQNLARLPEEPEPEPHKRSLVIEDLPL